MTAPVAGPRARPAELRVLVVDDEPDIRTVLALTLKRAGFVVETAPDGLEGLEKLVARPPDLVILDVMMPRLDGFETLKRIRERADEAASVPVIMLTARAQVADRMAGFERGADDYVAKPFEPAEVVARVSSLLKRTADTRWARPLMGLLGSWGSTEGIAYLTRDLEAARRIQTGLMPTVPKEIAGFGLGAVLQPSMAVSGDFLDLLPMEDRVGVVVGDVSGKGISAALMMVMVRTLLREIASTVASPAQVLTRLNNSLCRDMPSNMFVTLVLAVLDPAATGKLWLANAGHPSPLLIGPGGARPTKVDGFLLGVVPDSEYEEQEIRLSPGEGLVLFSDGVVETPGPEGQRPGPEWLARFLVAHREETAPALAEAVASDVLRRAGTAVRDDVTVVVLNRL